MAENREFEVLDAENKIIKVLAKRIGREWRANCPFHNDIKHPNLDINEEKGVYLCRACGASGRLNGAKFVSKKMIEQVYDYKNEEGQLVFQVVRYARKDFKQRRPDGKGGFIWNLKDVKRVIYNLPEILKKQDKPIFICEGERDCDNLAKIGILATTNSGGAGKWRAEYNRYFKGREVILLPDNDEIGFKHAQDIGRSLNGIAKFIKWLILPGLKKGEDVSDWMERGGNLEKLFELVKTCPDFSCLATREPEEEKKKKKEAKKERTRTLIPGLIHLVRNGETAGYLLQNSGKFYIEEIYNAEDGTVCRPKKDLPIYYCEPEIIEESREVDYRKLLDTVISFIKNYLELPSERGYLILALWVFHTYIIEKFSITPIIYFCGVKETGKTRAGEVLGELAFRCERMTSPTEATLFRSADYFKTALIIDEVKLWGSNGNEEVSRLIKSRYKRGLKVSRINLNKKGEDQVEYFDVFAPLVISTTESIPPIIESRCIGFLMQKNKEQKVEGIIDLKLAKSIRNKLTISRANYMDRKLKEVTPVSRRRLNEILMPLYQVLMEIAPDLENEFKLIVKGLEQDREIEEEFTIEAEIVEAVVEYYNETREMTFLNSEIANRLNKDKSERDKFSPQFIGRRLVSLGFKKKRLINGKRGFCFELNFLEKLITQYRTKNIEAEENLF